MRGYNDGYERHFDAQIEKVGPRVVWAIPGVVVKDLVGVRGLVWVQGEKGQALDLEEKDQALVQASVQQVMAWDSVSAPWHTVARS